jgi:hypothetical protein
MRELSRRVTLNGRRINEEPAAGYDRLADVLIFSCKIELTCPYFFPVELQFFLGHNLLLPDPVLVWAYKEVDARRRSGDRSDRTPKPKVRENEIRIEFK